MRAKRTLLAGVVLIIVSTTAAQADWRYCYALDVTEHRFYMSAPFTEPRAMEILEGAFRRMLAAEAIQYQSLACPRGDDRTEIQERIQQAASFNRANGNIIVPLDWTANGLVAHPRSGTRSPQ
jgi:hypothetical protein